MQGSDDLSSGFKSPEAEADNDLKAEQKLSSHPVQASLPDTLDQSNNSLAMLPDKSDDLSVDVSTETSSENKIADSTASPNDKKPTTISNGLVRGKRPTVWGRTAVSACYLDLCFGLSFSSVISPKFNVLRLNDFACKRHLTFHCESLSHHKEFLFVQYKHF